MFQVHLEHFPGSSGTFFRFIWNMANAFTTAFGTGSSSATLPVTISLLEEKNQVINHDSCGGDDIDGGDDDSGESPPLVMVMILMVVMAMILMVAMAYRIFVSLFWQCLSLTDSLTD